MLGNAWARWVPRLVLAALAGGVPAFAVIAPSLEGAPAHVLEIEMAADTGGILQVFYDRGAGISAADTAVVPLAASTEPQVYRLSLPLGRYRLFRIDPNDRPGRYRFTRLRIVDGAGDEVARVPLGALRPALQATVESLDDNGLAITTTLLANDPQLFYEPSPPIVLVPGRADLTRAGWLAAVSGLVVLLLVTLLDRLAWLSALLAKTAHLVRRRPYAAVVIAGLAGTLVATYPLLLGRSLVSPGNGPTNLLYDQPPFAFGATDRQVEDARSTDVGAMMWAILPYTMVQREALAHGEFPLWNRYNTIGEPLWGQGQTFIMDPFHLASLAIPDPAVAMDVRFVVGRAVFAIGAGLTVALVTGDGLAGLLVALLAPFVGHFTSRFNHPAYFSIVYAPWILLAYAWLARLSTFGHRLRAGAFIAVATYLQFVGSTPKEGLIALVGAHIAGLAGLLVASGSWKERLGRLVAALLGGVVAVLLAAPHWLIFLGTLGRSYTLYDTPQVQLANWPALVGYVLGGAVPGLPVTSANPLVVMAAVCALAYPRRLAASGVGLGAALAVAGLGSVAFGALPPDLLMRLPLVANIHHIANTFLGATIAPLLVVAGVGLAGALDEARRGAPLRLTVAVALATVALAGLVPGGPFNVAGALGTLGVVGAAVALLMLASCRRRVTTGAVLAVACAASATVFVDGLQLETGAPAIDALLIQPRGRADLDAASPALRALPSRDENPYRVAPVEGVLFPGTQAYWKLEGIGGPDALRLPAIESLSDAAGVERTPWGWWTILRPEQLDRVRPYLDMLNVRYLVARPDQVPRGATVLPMDGPDLVSIVARPTAWPRAFFTEGVGRHHGVAEFAARLQDSTGPFSSVDEQDVSAVEAVRTLPRTGAVTPAHGYELTPNSTSFRVETTSPGLAVLAEGYVEDDFQATVNGRDVAYFRVNHALRGVVIPGPGTWHVTFTYRPNGWGLSWILTVLGLTLLALMCWQDLCCNRRRAGNKPARCAASRHPSGRQRQKGDRHAGACTSRNDGGDAGRDGERRPGPARHHVAFVRAGVQDRPGFRR